jgi:hypothetical protein
MSNFPASLPLAKLYERTSKKGSQYFVGRLGLARVTLLRSTEVSESGDQVWTLLLQEPPSQPQAPAKTTASARRAGEQLFGSRPRKASAATPDLPDDSLDDVFAERSS